MGNARPLESALGRTQEPGGQVGRLVPINALVTVYGAPHGRVVGRLPRPAPAPSRRPTAERLREGFALAGFVQSETECLLETFACYLGITLREIRTQLRRRVADLTAKFPSDIRS
jgi:hypothetical protein